MKTFHIAVRTALLCSLLWIGGTALLINEYIKVVQTKYMSDYDVEVSRKQE